MIVTRTKDEESFYRSTAMRIAETIRNHPCAKIGLSTGRTTKGVHRALVELYQEAPFDCTGIRIFAIDEVTGMSRSCPASCYAILLNEVIRPLGIPMEHFIMPDASAPDLEAECRRFEREVMGGEGPELIILGLGENGHLGFNQPGTPFGAVTHVSYMDDSLDARLRKENNIAPDVKMGGLTLGTRNLMQSRRLVMAANGTNKAEMVKKILSGVVTEEVPSSVLQLHPNCELILDPLAAQMV